MHGLQACLFKYITLAAYHIYAQCGEDALKWEVGGHALNSHGNYIVDHGKSWKNHGIVFLNFYGNTETDTCQKYSIYPYLFAYGFFNDFLLSAVYFS